MQSTAPSKLLAGLSATGCLRLVHFIKGSLVQVCGAPWCRELHKEVVVGIDEAMARHAKETDKVDLLTLKQLKGRVNVLEQQIVQDKARQLTVPGPLPLHLPVVAALGLASHSGDTRQCHELLSQYAARALFICRPWSISEVTEALSWRHTFAQGTRTTKNFLHSVMSILIVLISVVVAMPAQLQAGSSHLSHAVKKPRPHTLSEVFFDNIVNNTSISALLGFVPDHFA